MWETGFPTKIVYEFLLVPSTFTPSWPSTIQYPHKPRDLRLNLDGLLLAEWPTWADRLSKTEWQL
jgi:hypothetical protein